jgi:hypothetical protein
VREQGGTPVPDAAAFRMMDAMQEEPMDRRYFIEKSFVAGGAAIAAMAFSKSAFATNSRKILVLGGTSFLGPAIVVSELPVIRQLAEDIGPSGWLDERIALKSTVDQGPT